MRESQIFRKAERWKKKKKLYGTKPEKKIRKEVLE